MTAHVRFEGPVFDGKAAIEISSAVKQIRRKLGYYGASYARSYFNAQIKKNTGRINVDVRVITRSMTMERRGYTMPVEVTNATTDLAVTTSNACYGPWLEGTGSRNETTRFRGYHGFRLAAQALDRAAPRIAQRELDLALDRISNG